MNKAVITAAEDLLKALYGEEILEDPNFKDTPRRMSKAFNEILSGEADTFEKARGILCSVEFPTPYSGIIMAPKHRSFSMCPHHMLPVEYETTIAYFPNKAVTGASKLVRLIDLLSKRAVLQETFTEDLCFFMKDLLKPKGVAVFVKGIHMCMRCRGVKTRAPFVTQKLDGVFIENDAVRNELMLTMQNGGMEWI